MRRLIYPVCLVSAALFMVACSNGNKESKDDSLLNSESIEEVSSDIESAEDVVEKMEEIKEKVDEEVENAKAEITEAETVSKETVSESSEENTASVSVDVDELLDAYEKYVDKYVSLAKKIASGDMSAMSEYTSYLQQAQNLAEKLNDVHGEISSSQLVRYNEINMKMANAAANM